MNKIKEQFIEKASSNEMLDIVECIGKAEEANLLIEVVYTALKEMSSHPKLQLKIGIVKNNFVY